MWAIVLLGSEGEGKVMEDAMKGSEEDLLIKKGVPVREVMWMVAEYVMVWPFMCHVGLVLFVAWMASCYHFNVPFVSVLGFIYLFQIDQRQRQKLIRRIRHEGKKGANKLRMEEGETVRWMNEVVEIIWPIFMESFASQFIVKPLTWFLNQYKPWTAKNMVVQSMCLGKTPPIITMIRKLAQPMEGDDLAIEASLEFVADKHMSSVLAVQIRRRIGLGLWTTVHISNVHVEGKVLKFLHKLIENLPWADTAQIEVKIGIKFVKGWPLIGRIRLCFATAPYVQVTACPLFNSGVDVAELPLIAQWLDRFLADALTNSLVEPNFLVVDVEKLLRDVLRPENLVPLSKSEKWFKMEESPPVAEIILEVLEATDLKIADMNGYSDPFVRFTLGLKHFATKVKWKTLNPKWNEKFKLPITTWERPNILLLKVRDKDRFIDDDLGSCFVELSQYRDGKRHALWLNLEHVNTGKIHLAITVLEKQNEPISSDETLSNSTTFETSQEPNQSGLPIPTSPGGLVPPLEIPSPLVPIPREQLSKQESPKTDVFVLGTPKTSRLRSGSWFGSWSLRKVDSSIVRSGSGRSVMSVENPSPMGGASGEISKLTSTPGSPVTGTTEQEQAQEGHQLEEEAQFDDDDDSTNVIDVGFGELGAVSICQLGDFQPASWPSQKAGAPKRVDVVKLEHGMDKLSDQSCSDTESLTNVEENGGAARKIRSAGNKVHKIFHRPRMETEKDAAEPSPSSHRYQEDVSNPSKPVTPPANGTTIQTAVESWDEQGQNINSSSSPVEHDPQIPSSLSADQDQDSEVSNEQGGDSEKQSGHGRAKGLLNMAGNMAGRAASHMGHQLSKRMMRHHRKNVDKEGPSIAAEYQTTFSDYPATSKDFQQPIEPSKADDNSSSKGRRLGNMFSQRRGAPATTSTNLFSDVADSSAPPCSIHQTEELHQTGNQPGAATSPHEPPSRPPPVLPQALNIQPNVTEIPLDLLPPSGSLQFKPPLLQQPDSSTFVQVDT